jgi:AcrR family transcriptional regulator
VTNRQDGLIKDKTSEKIIEITEQLVMTEGAHAVTVRKILQRLNVTNRVFYNRFRNIEEVLEIVYTDMMLKMRESISVEYDGKQDFFEFVIDAVTQALVMSYDVKMQFNQYVFENDSHSQANYEWYLSTIKRFFDYAKTHDLIKDVNADDLSYAIWCFCRGYNADAVMRLSKEEAVQKFRYSFGILLNGIKK